MRNKRAARHTISVGLGALLAGALFLTISTVAAPAGASVGDPTPRSVDGDAACDALGYNIAYRLDAPLTNGQHGTITIANLGVAGGRMEFDWASSQLWNAVIVRHEGTSLIYEYDPARNNDQDVQAASDEISQVRFCARSGVTTTTTPTTSTTTATTVPTTSSTTTSSTTTSSTTTSSTTTSSTTTSSTVPSTSSSTPPTVLDTVITRPGTTTRPGTQVRASETLPRTGNDTGWLAGTGAGLVLLGSTFLLIGGRRARLH